MDRAEAKRRARVAAWHILTSVLDDGFDLGLYTDDGSAAQIAMIEAAVRDVRREINMKLPIGYEVPGMASRERAEAEQAQAASRDGMDILGYLPSDWEWRLDAVEAIYNAEGWDQERIYAALTELATAGYADSRTVFGSAQVRINAKGDEQLRVLAKEADHD